MKRERTAVTSASLTTVSVNANARIIFILDGVMYA